ncbi:MAG: dihydroneopterin aldolase [Anaerolineae bacterium]|nr:dihydroneopterin aldolase [Anaerolineae bacterium]
MDIIEIDNLRLRCEIGFSAHEIGVKQDVVLTLRIGADMRRAGQTDDPNDAFNYRTGAGRRGGALGDWGGRAVGDGARAQARGVALRR